ncbi:MAG: hypothetical protein ACRD1B_11940, partial [Thermoanaerobaculia bacterium]
MTSAVRVRASRPGRAAPIGWLLFLAGSLLSLGLSQRVEAQGINVDASSSMHDDGGNSMTWAHTTSGSNRILIVGVAIRQNSGGEFVDSITYNGVNLTFVDGISFSTLTSIRAEMWQLVAPATGPHNIIVTINPNGGPGAQSVAGGAQ